MEIIKYFRTVLSELMYLVTFHHCSRGLENIKVTPLPNLSHNLFNMKLSVRYKYMLGMFENECTL